MNKNEWSKEKSIVFIGFMGVGKTTMGKLVAEKLHREFIDIDEVIGNEYNMPTIEIFAKIGERAFREKEKETIFTFCKQKSKIISLGGGAFLQEDIRDFCLEHCTVIALDMSFESWKDRLDDIIDSRPVLQGKSMKDIEDLFNKRKEIYSTHHSKITTDHRDPEEVAESIVESLTNAWELPK